MRHSFLAIAVIAVLLVLPAWGQTVDERASRIAARLRCPVCQNESVADSPSELAAQMRALIREKLTAGQTDDQIIAYFVSKYGQWILLEPPRRGLLWLVWLAPGLALLVGAGIAVVYLRRAAGASTARGDVRDLPSSPTSPFYSANIRSINVSTAPGEKKQ